MSSLKYLLSPLGPVALLASTPVLMSAAPASAAEPQDCPVLQPANIPHTTISNGAVSAVVLLPDAEKGLYRGMRFDWSGMVWCLTYRGHNYFGMWNPRFDTASGNAVTGPAEEFFGADGRTGIGYDQAKPGELFVKPGVGVLRRVDEQNYSINGRYPIVDGGKRSVRVEKRGVLFRHELKSPTGVSYVYDKRLALDAREPVLVLEHAMKNTGATALEIQVYDHDFFVLDDSHTGPDTTLRFFFDPVADRSMQNGARIEGRRIVYEHELAEGQTAQTNISGFSDKATDFHFVVENARTGVGVEETGDRPISKIVFWSNPRTVAPEAYVHLTIRPGETGRWTIRYRFFAPAT